MHTEFVLDALEQALYDRKPSDDGSLMHHSDRGLYNTCPSATAALAEAGIEPSVGPKGDSYDNAPWPRRSMALQGRGNPSTRAVKTKQAVGLATLEWVAWFNHHRLMEPLGYIPPAEFEANYHRQRAGQAATVANWQASRVPGRFGRARHPRVFSGDGWQVWSAANGRC